MTSNSIKECGLCKPSISPVLMESEHWRLVLNHNQNLLGKCFLVLRRHIEAMVDLTPDEWASLQPEVAQATLGLKAAFAPYHFNYAFLQNQDRHVHLHIIPRYATPRTFSGMIFADPDYPAHYSVPSPSRRLVAEELAAIVEALKQHLPDSSQNMVLGVEKR